MGEKRYMISDAAKKVDVEPHVLRYWEDEVGIEIPRNEMGHRYYRKEDIVLMRSVKDLKDKGFQLRAIKLLIPDLPRIESMDTERLIDLKNRLDLALGEEPSTAGPGQEALFSALHTPGQEVPSATPEGRCSNQPEGGCSGPPEDELVADISAHLCSEHSELHASGTGEEKMLQFRTIMSDIVSASVEGNNRALIEELNRCLTKSITQEMDLLLTLREEREEERFRSIDRMIREHQNSRGQAAAAKESYGRTSRKKDSKFFRKHSNVHI